MTAITKIKYLSLAALLGTWSCTSNQQVTSNKVIYDDLYGRPADKIVAQGSALERQKEEQLYSNPDFAAANDASSGISTDDYYDDSYLSARNYKWDKSQFNGYDIGYNDGYSNALRNTAFTPFNTFGYGWPMGSRLSLGFGFGMGSYIGFGYSPFMYNGFYDPFLYNSFYDPYGYAFGGGWGYPYYGAGFYNGFGGWGYPYFNRYYGYPTVIINNYEGVARTRTYGPRGSSVSSSRTSSGVNSYSGRNASSGRSTLGSTRQSSADYTSRGSRNSVAASSRDSYYVRPRNTDSYYSESTRSARSSSEFGNSRSARSTSPVSNGEYYYSRPRSVTTGSSSSVITRESRSFNNNGSTGSYQAPSRSYDSSPANNSYRSNTNTYQAPSRSSGSSYSAPSRSYSAPSGGGGGGGRSASPSRGSR